ncbi:hypothetical protein SCHPADRAFT_544580 [Schizopora paradoxa]|uniref:Uncharacterized protein n=1 Tax=Schizopora paradoxa TaxID=27342 RepID=A0A0H2RDJ2_9AGAM|nr:hypothetical protein SCHPADRAFT_544580 [Schizopora paradoxa]
MSSIPRFANPYSERGRESQLQIVSRADIFHDGLFGSTAHDLDGDEGRLEDEGVKALEECVRASMGVDGLVLMTRGVGEEAVVPKKKKRRRDEMEEVEAADGHASGEMATRFEFRLFSGRDQPALISVQPKFLERVSIERTCEESETALQKRSQRALEVAVDFSWLEGQSKLTYPSPLGRSKLRILHTVPSAVTVSSCDPSQSSSALLLLERPKSPRAQKPLPAKQAETSTNSEIPCRNPNVRCCKTVEFYVPERKDGVMEVVKETRRQRRPRCPRRGRARGVRSGS